MKSIITLAATAAIVMIAGAAQADSVKITGAAAVDADGGKSSVALDVSGDVGFTPTNNTIVVTVAGKTCTMGSSTQGSVPKGCNYEITVSGAGVSVKPTEASDVCMQITPTCN